MNNYSKDIDLLFEELEQILTDDVALEVKKQTLQHWLESIYDEAYQEGLNEGLDHLF